MKPRTPALVCSLLALFGCGRHEPAAPPVVPIAAPAAAPAAAPQASRPQYADACADYRARLDQTLHAAIARIGDAGAQHWTKAALQSAINDAGLHCFSFARGAWWIEPGSEVDLDDGLEISTDATVRAKIDGRSLAPWSPGPGGIHVGHGSMPTTMRDALAGDYDSDGVPELWVRTDEDGVEGGHFAESWVLTIKNGAIREYAPAKWLGKVGAPP